MKTVFIHGWGFSKDIFKDYYYLDNSLFLDLPFHGGFKDFEKNNIFENYVNYVSNKINEKTTLIGWSLGGSVAFLTALKNPFIEKLVLIGFSPKFNDSLLGSDPKVIKAFMLNLNNDFENTVYQFRKEGSKELLKEYINLDLTEKLHLVDIPTYIIHGDKDLIVNPNSAIYCHEKIKNSQLILLDSSHAPFLERDILQYIDD
jgi:pimeloyl-[acyl-carrier protein] methyl ester esterase